MLIMFQAKDLVLMAVETGLTPTSQEVRGNPAVSQGWNWLRTPCNPPPLQPLPPSYPITHFVPQSAFASPGATVSPKSPLLWCGARWPEGKQYRRMIGLKQQSGQAGPEIVPDYRGEENRLEGVQEDRDRGWKAGRERLRWWVLVAVEGEKWPVF